jgi:hypothetical protein
LRVGMHGYIHACVVIWVSTTLPFENTKRKQK